ncbi:hypothetical protein SIN8267_03111 [Sinobacterium norvegicum]|uniref:ABC transporter permease n=1 Tax=Sinobacterium norvegicum TaxID=1641715 RepID=A0ABN8EKV2_9GAMM|nr:hypothetical protein [Sinobacterium norvegicum]CAH0992972.1 hypothetical protein SIN8267_03111 [Sinobacterium norvegicum]
MLRQSTAIAYRNIAAIFLFFTAIAFYFGDFTLYQTDPLAALQHFASGFLSPQISSLDELIQALLTTIAFALIGVAASVVPGFLLALVYHFTVVRWLCSFGRAVHEIFWGLLFLQVFGLSASTGLLAIIIPFSCIFAKVYSEQWASHGADADGIHGDSVSVLIYGRLARSWTAMCHYTRYRFECGLRSATLLGFIGLPTIGYHLDTALKQLQYQESATYLLLFYLLTATIKYWLRPALIPLYLIAAVALLPAFAGTADNALWRFISQDIIPYPLQNGVDGSAIAALWPWLSSLMTNTGWLAIVNTLILTVAATAVSALLCLALFPLASNRIDNPVIAFVGKAMLVVFRATPELLFVFIILLMTGPSMLPALIALALHNGALLAFLLAKELDNIDTSEHETRGVNGWCYFWLPRVFGPFLSLLLYRTEHILRESAIVGIIGITTLGFYIDSGFEDLHFDTAFFFIVITALLTLVTDSISRRAQRYIGN